MDSGYWLYMTRRDYDVATLLEPKASLLFSHFCCQLISCIVIHGWAGRVAGGMSAPVAQQLERACIRPWRPETWGGDPCRPYSVWCAFSQTASRPLIGTGRRWQNSVVESTSPVLPRH